MDAEIRPNVPINGKLYFDFQGALRALKRSEHTLRREIGRKRIRFLDYGRAKYFLNGEEMTISQASRKYGIGKTTIRFRLSKGLKGKYLIAKPHKGKRLCGRKLSEDK